MNDHRLDGVDADAAACSSLDDVLEPMTPQPNALNRSKEKSHELDTVYMADNAATTTGSVPSDHSSTSILDNVLTVRGLLGETTYQLVSRVRQQKALVVEISIFLPVPNSTR